MFQPDLDLLQHGDYAPRVSKEASVDNDALLRRHGLQVTAQRLAVLLAVSDRPHSKADGIEKGVLRRIQHVGSPARYENRVGDNHHHVICRTCNRMADVDCAVGNTPCLAAADSSGYEIHEADVIYWDRCPECVAATSVSSGD